MQHRLGILQTVAHKTHAFLQSLFQDWGQITHLDDTFRVIHPVVEAVVRLRLEKFLGAEQLQEVHHRTIVLHICGRRVVMQVDDALRAQKMGPNYGVVADVVTAAFLKKVL